MLKLILILTLILTVYQVAIVHAYSRGDQNRLCLLPKVTGPCRAYFRKWYYNMQENECYPFIYGGCQGNGNNFSSYRKCMTACS